MSNYATNQFEKPPAYSKADECDLVLTMRPSEKRRRAKRAKVFCRGSSHRQADCFAAQRTCVRVTVPRKGVCALARPGAFWFSNPVGHQMSALNGWTASRNVVKGCGFRFHR